MIGLLIIVLIYIIAIIGFIRYFKKRNKQMPWFIKFSLVFGSSSLLFLAIREFVS